MSRRKITKAQKLAAILLQQYHDRYPENQALQWPAAYELESLFGVSPDSQWKGVEQAVKACLETTNPGPFATYDFSTHTIHVRNGCMLTRAVKLKDIPE